MKLSPSPNRYPWSISTATGSVVCSIPYFLNIGSHDVPKAELETHDALLSTSQMPELTPLYLIISRNFKYMVKQTEIGDIAEDGSQQ